MSDGRDQGVSCTPEALSQIFTVLSALLVTMRRPSGENATDQTSRLVSARIIWICCLVRTSQMRAVRSS